MIGIIKAYKNGLSNALNEKKMIFWIYGFNLLIAYALTLPVSMILSNALDKTIATERMLSAFDLTIMTTIIRDFASGFSLFRWVITIALFYLVLNIFFAGGILNVFTNESRFKLSDFLAGCVKYFNRFLRLFAISLLFLIAVIFINMLLSKLSGFITENSTTEHVPVILFISRYFFLILLLALTNMLFDYAKIITVVNDFHGMFGAVKISIMFVMMSMRKTTGLYGLYFITAVFLLVLYLIIESVIHVDSGLMVLIFFLWTQIYMITKVWIRMSFFAGQFNFYKYANTAMPGMSKEILDSAVADYERRVLNRESENES